MKDKQEPDVPGGFALTVMLLIAFSLVFSYYQANDLRKRVEKLEQQQAISESK